MGDIQSSLQQFTVPNNLNGCKKEIAVNSSCTLTVDFTPTETTSYQGTLAIFSNASIPSAFLDVSGSGTEGSSRH